MRELLICDQCGHQADGVRALRVVESFASADADGDLDVVVVECPCGARGEVPVTAA